MPLIHRMRSAMCIAAAMLLLHGLALADNMTRSPRGVTRPSEIAELSFINQGLLREVLVKPGEAVSAGQVLMVQDDRREAAALQILELQAKSDLRVQAAEAELDLKEVIYERLKELANRASVRELEEARLAVVMGKLQLRLAYEEQEEKGLHANRQEVTVELMRLISPIDGLVERVDAAVGQVVDPSRVSCVVVKIDPLWVEVRQLRSHQIAHLRTGQTVQVSYTDDKTDEGEREWFDARIIFISAMGDAASGTQLVRLELPNPSGRASGQEVEVRIPPPGEAPHARADEN